MKFNPLKLIALTVSSGLFISSIPTKAESLKTNYEVLQTNSLNNTLLAETPLYRVIKKAIVRKNGYLKLKLVNPVESVSGSVVVNSPTGSIEYFIKDAAIKKKSITWSGGAEKVFSNKSALRIDTSKLKGLKFTGNTVSPAVITNKKILAFTTESSGALVSSYGGVAAGTATVGAAGAAAVVAPAAVAGISAAAIVGGVVAAGVAIGASSSGSGSSSSN
tara:strand:- start:4458 stop:5114 length:657 start_codon:yes stop_codon:yes gene_type:complete